MSGVYSTYCFSFISCTYPGHILHITNLLSTVKHKPLDTSASRLQEKQRCIFTLNSWAPWQLPCGLTLSGKQLGLSLPHLKVRRARWQCSFIICSNRSRCTAGKRLTPGYVWADSSLVCSVITVGGGT